MDDPGLWGPKFLDPGKKTLIKAGKIGAKEKGKPAPVPLHLTQLRCLRALGERKQKPRAHWKAGHWAARRGDVGRVGGKGKPGTPAQGQGPSTLIAPVNRLQKHHREQQT